MLPAACLGLGEKGEREGDSPAAAWEGSVLRSRLGWEFGGIGMGMRSPRELGREHLGLNADWLHVGGNSTGEEGECSTPGAGGIKKSWGVQS